MKSISDQLSSYAAYHRDRRNIATHVVGIPLIVFAVTILLARTAWSVPGLPFALTPAMLAAAAAGLYYLRLDLRFGAVMSALLALSVWGSAGLATGSTTQWLCAGLGLFVVGWLIQFIGHYFEGRKPAFVDDLMGLVIGPLFVVAELAFMLGLRRELHREVLRRAGPTLVRRSAAGATGT
jgi:uncharacterized membrane protein YGL010W